MTQRIITCTGHSLIVFPELEAWRRKMYMPLLLEHGGSFKASLMSAPGHSPDIFDHRLRCFDAAMALAKRDGLFYVEGLAIITHSTGVATVAHGWCVDFDGMVVDPTMWFLQGHQWLSYYGIPIKQDYSDQWKQKSGYYGVLDGYPGRTGDIYYDHPSLYVEISCPRVKNPESLIHLGI